MGASITPSGMDVSAAALRYWEQRQNIASSNIANVSTDGFKGERAFAQLLGDGAAPTVRTATDLSAGPISTTGAPLDLADPGAGLLRRADAERRAPHARRLDADQRAASAGGPHRRSRARPGRWCGRSCRPGHDPRRHREPRHRLDAARSLPTANSSRDSAWNRRPRARRSSATRTASSFPPPR